MNFKVVSAKGVQTHFKHATSAFAYWKTQQCFGAKYHIRTHGKWEVMS